MPTFIKPGFWEKKVKGYKEWLNLDLLIESIAGGGGSQNLQQVTDVGNTTTNDIYVGDLNDSYVQISKSISPGNDDTGINVFNNKSLGYVQSTINNVNDTVNDIRQGYINTAVNNVGTNDYVASSLYSYSSGIDTYASIGINKTSGGSGTGFGIEHGDTNIGSVLRYGNSNNSGSYIKFDENTISTYVYTSGVLTSSVNTGLKLDFANQIYQFGGYNEHLEYGIKIDNTQIQIGDYEGFGQGSGPVLSIIQDAGRIIKTNTFGESDKGLRLDFDNLQYSFGDFYNINNGSNITITDSTRTIALQAGQSFNNTSLILSDNSSTIEAQYQNDNVGLKLDFGNYIYQLGNLSGLTGATYIQINDNLSVINFVAGNSTYNFATMPAYANNAAALLGGLVVGDLYRNSANDALNIVH